MAIIFFEGFESIGTITGSGNEAQARERLDKIMTVSDGIGIDASNSFLVPGESGLGYAWDTNGAANTVGYPLPAALQVLTNGDAPTITMGCSIHVPSEDRSFKCISLEHSGSFAPTLTVENSTDLVFAVSASERDRADDVLTKGFWNHIEFRVKPSGLRGPVGDADVAALVADGAITMEINTVEVDVLDWSPLVTYPVSDEVQFGGIMYVSTLVMSEPEPPEIAAPVPNLNKRPDVDPDFWTASGAAVPGSEAIIPFGTDFYFESRPDLLYTTNSFDAATTLTFTPAIDEFGDFGLGNLPQIGDRVVFGGIGSYEVRVNGSTVMSNARFGTMLPGDLRTLEEIRWSGSAGTITPATPFDFCAYDNLVIDDAGGFIGPARVTLLIPESTVQGSWQVNPDGAAHYTQVRGNPSSETTHVFSDDNGAIEKFSHSPVTQSGDVYAVKVEAEVRNQTAGLPSLELSVRSVATDTMVSHPVESDGESIIVCTLAETDPNGGDWTAITASAAQSKLQVNLNLGP